MDKTISIIIPTYNMEAYLGKCLSSLVMDKGMERVEAIVVNDGSKDGSLAIAKDFAGKYPSTFRIIDKQNGNYGSCINAALKVATGKYVKILDADDSFDNGSFREFVDVLERTDVDLVLNDKMNVGQDGETLSALKYTQKEVFDFFKESDGRLFISIMMHNVTYRRSIFNRIDYNQSEGIFYTDNEWIFSPMACVEKAIYFDKPLYRYTIGREGQSVSNDVILSHIHDEIAMSAKLVSDYCSMTFPSDKVHRLMLDKLYHHVRWLYKLVIVKSPGLDSRILQTLDVTIARDTPELYRMLDNKMLSTPLFCIKYIRKWRQNPDSRLLRFVIKWYLKIKE